MMPLLQYLLLSSISRWKNEVNVGTSTPWDAPNFYLISPSAAGGERNLVTFYPKVGTYYIEDER